MDKNRSNSARDVPRDNSACYTPRPQMSQPAVSQPVRYKEAQSSPTSQPVILKTEDPKKELKIVKLGERQVYSPDTMTSMSQGRYSHSDNLSARDTTFKSPKEHVPKHPEGYEPPPPKRSIPSVSGSLSQRSGSNGRTAVSTGRTAVSGGRTAVLKVPTYPRVSPMNTQSGPRAGPAVTKVTGKSTPIAKPQTSPSIKTLPEATRQSEHSLDQRRELQEYRDLRNLRDEREYSDQLYQERQARRERENQEYGRHEYGRGSHAPVYSKNVYRTQEQPMGEIQAIRFPDTMIEMVTAYGTFKVKDYRNATYQEREIAFGSFVRKFEQLQRDWGTVGDVTIALPVKGEDITAVALRYAETEKTLMNRTGSDFWFLCLCGLWGFVQYCATQMGFKVDGYIQVQIRTSDMYRRQLNKAGMAGDMVAFGEDWSPLMTVVITSIVSCAVIVVLNKLNIGGDASILTKEIAGAICGNSAPVEMSPEGTPMPPKGGLAEMAAGAIDTMSGGAGGFLGDMFGMFSGFMGGGKSDKKRKRKDKKAAKEKRREAVEIEFDD